MTDRRLQTDYSLGSSSGQGLATDNGTTAGPERAGANCLRGVLHSDQGRPPPL